jgi:hypothetical protein
MLRGPPSVSLPSLDNYLAQLPDGLRSYPDALAKATVIMPFREGPVGAALRECGELPAPLRNLLEQPLAVSEWIPEVRLVGLIQTAYDVHFAHAGGAEALQGYIRTTNRAVFKGPLYSILFAVVSPERLLTGAAQRWSAFHRGSKLEVAQRSAGRAVLVLTHPPNLFSNHSLHGHGTSFALAAEMAGGRDVHMSFERTGTDLTRYTIAWR